MPRHSYQRREPEKDLSFEGFRNFFRHGHKPTFAPYRAIGRPIASGQHRNNAENGIAAEKSQTHPFITGLAHMVIHLQAPIFVMPHRDESLSAQQTLWIGVRVDIGDIGDIIPVLLQPKGQWEFPR